MGVSTCECICEYICECIYECTYAYQSSSDLSRFLCRSSCNISISNTISYYNTTKTKLCDMSSLVHATWHILTKYLKLHHRNHSAYAHFGFYLLLTTLCCPCRLQFTAGPQGGQKHRGKCGGLQWKYAWHQDHQSDDQTSWLYKQLFDKQRWLRTPLPANWPGLKSLPMLNGIGSECWWQNMSQWVPNFFCLKHGFNQPTASFLRRGKLATKSYEVSVLTPLYSDSKCWWEESNRLWFALVAVISQNNTAGIN